MTAPLTKIDCPAGNGVTVTVTCLPGGSRALALSDDASPGEDVLIAELTGDQARIIATALS